MARPHLRRTCGFRCWSNEVVELKSFRTANVTLKPFAPANQYAVLFRDNDWNDYRIVAIGDHLRIYVNGTLFSELQDQQTGEQDLKGVRSHFSFTAARKPESSFAIFALNT